jgi:enamine deaminase RidA (YjgF/YER057c/UK114 family)
MAKTTLNPDGLPVPRGSYSLVNIAQPGRMVFIAGQTASDHEGKVIGAGDARARRVSYWGRFNAPSKPPAER